MTSTLLQGKLSSDHNNFAVDPGGQKRIAAALRLPGTVAPPRTGGRRNLAAFCVPGAGVGRRIAPDIPQKWKCFQFSGIPFVFLLEIFYVFRYIIPENWKTCHKTGIEE